MNRRLRGITFKYDPKFRRGLGVRRDMNVPGLLEIKDSMFADDTTIIQQLKDLGYNKRQIALVLEM